MIRPYILARARLVLITLAVTLAAAMLPQAAFAQTRQEAQLLVQIQELQDQIRVLTGQVEGLQFQLTQMQSLIEKMTQDNEFRFQQLEGTAGAQPAPRTQNNGALDSNALPADPTTTSALPDPQPLTLGTGEAGAPLPADDELGQSADPLVGTNETGSLPLGGGDATLDGNRPLDLSLSSTASLSNGDADAQYRAGYDAIVRGDYAFAEDQFQQFVSLYPDDPHAADATNWLGEAMIQRGAYDDAALVLAEGYQKYQKSERAPDLMLKLGIALSGAGEQEVACRTFFTLAKRYTNLAPAFTQRLNDEKSKANCPV